MLKQIHDDLDAAVAEAYGWPADLRDEEILRRLVALACYFDHCQEIETDFRREEELAEKLRPLFPSKLQEKLRG